MRQPRVSTRGTSPPKKASRGAATCGIETRVTDPHTQQQFMRAKAWQFGRRTWPTCRRSAALEIGAIVDLGLKSEAIACRRSATHSLD